MVLWISRMTCKKEFIAVESPKISLGPCWLFLQTSEDLNNAPIAAWKWN